jgi:hypothetical protein
MLPPPTVDNGFDLRLLPWIFIHLGAFVFLWINLLAGPVVTLSLIFGIIQSLSGG